MASASHRQCCFDAVVSQPHAPRPMANQSILGKNGSGARKQRNRKARSVSFADEVPGGGQLADVNHVESFKVTAPGLWSTSLWQVWTCSSCTLLNHKPHALACDLCGMPRFPNNVPADYVQQSSSQSVSGTRVRRDNRRSPTARSVVNPSRSSRSCSPACRSNSLMESLERSILEPDRTPPSSPSLHTINSKHRTVPRDAIQKDRRSADFHLPTKCLRNDRLPGIESLNRCGLCRWDRETCRCNLQSFRRAPSRPKSAEDIPDVALQLGAGALDKQSRRRFFDIKDGAKRGNADGFSLTDPSLQRRFYTDDFDVRTSDMHGFAREKARGKGIGLISI